MSDIAGDALRYKNDPGSVVRLAVPYAQPNTLTAFLARYA